MNISYDGGSSAILYFPIPLTFNDDGKTYAPSDLMNDLVIKEGHADHDIATTERGKALRIKVKEHLIIEAKRECQRAEPDEYEGYCIDDLSMKDDEGPENVSVVIDLFECYWECIPGSEMEHRWELRDETIQSGWTSIEMSA